jgi:hypothetical protein
MSARTPYIMLRPLATADRRTWFVRREAITAVVCTRSARGVDAEVFVQGLGAPIRPREQGDDILCDLGAFEGRCRACLAKMPAADRYGGICPDCRASAELERRAPA